jgi:hypothetical protein
VSQLDAGIGGGEAPVDRGAAIVAVLLPGGDFAPHFFDAGDAPLQALSIERTQFDFGYVEPVSMFGSVMDLKFFSQPPRLGRRKLS